MNRIRHIFYWLFSLLCFWSCVNENFDDCPKDLFLNLNIKVAKYNFVDIVKDVTIYVFDSEGKLSNKYFYLKDDINISGSAVKLPRPQKQGKHTFLVIVNHAEEDYITVDDYQCETIRTKLIVDEEDFTIDRKQTDLYHGYVEIDVKNTNSVITEKVDLAKNTNNVNLSIEIANFNDYQQNSTVFSRIIGANGTYNYANVSVGTEEITYIPHTSNSSITRSGNKLSITDSYRTMRLWKDDGIKINLYRELPGLKPIELTNIELTNRIFSIKDSSGNPVYSDNEALWQQDEFDIYVLLDGNTNAILELRIGPWTLISIDPEL